MTRLALLLLPLLLSACSSLELAYVTPVSERGNHTPITGIQASAETNRYALARLKVEYEKVATEESAFLLAARTLLETPMTDLVVEGGIGQDITENTALYRVGMGLESELDIYGKWSTNANVSYENAPEGHNSKTRLRLGIKRAMTENLSLGLRYETHDQSTGGQEIEDMLSVLMEWKL